MIYRFWADLMLTDLAEMKSMSFVGSNQAGEHIWKRAGAAGKRMQINMAAKNHAAILPDSSRAHVTNSLVVCTTEPMP